MLCHFVSILYYLHNSPVSQNVRPLVVALVSYTRVDKITKNTVVSHAKTFEMTKPSNQVL